MLGNLQASMDKQGVSATQKGVCAACHKPIVGQVRILYFQVEKETRFHITQRL